MSGEEKPSALDKYVISSVLGEGAFSIVYKVEEKETGLLYAMKKIKKDSLTDSGDLVRLQREIDTMAYLQHESVVALHDFIIDENHFYLIMDYCQGGSLYEHIVSGQQIREPQAALVFRQIVNAIMFIHQHGVVHRDLKPQNILITKFPQIKVSDFGLCGFLNEDKKMKTFCGSPCYSAPECLNHIQYDGTLSDMWSLGVILYEMVTGEHPWQIRNTTAMMKQIVKGDYTVPPTVSSACADLIRNLMKIRPCDRLSCTQVLNHPWMTISTPKLQQRAKEKRYSLPPLKQVQVQQFLSKVIEQTDRKKEDGIVNPFPVNRSLPKIEVNTKPAGLDKLVARTRPNLQLQRRSIKTSSLPRIGICHSSGVSPR